MRLLLDTHIWIWDVAAPERLSKRLAKTLEHTGNELWLSPISTFKFSHSDPADHFLAASAKVFDLTLVTADPRLLALKSQGLSVFPN